MQPPQHSRNHEPDAKNFPYPNAQIGLFAIPGVSWRHSLRWLHDTWRHHYCRCSSIQPDQQKFPNRNKIANTPHELDSNWQKLMSLLCCHWCINLVLLLDGSSLRHWCLAVVRGDKGVPLLIGEKLSKSTSWNTQRCHHWRGCHYWRLDSFQRGSHCWRHGHTHSERLNGGAEGAIVWPKPFVQIMIL